LKLSALAIVTGLLACSARAQQIPSRPSPVLKPAQVVQEIRDYRMKNEDRIIRELTEFLAIPNVASDTENIQKNAARLQAMLEARGIETHLLPITGRGPVVFGKLNAPNARRTIIFYAHYDGQPVDPSAWSDGKPFEPELRSGPIESGGKRIPSPEDSPEHRAIYGDDWRIYARSSSDDKSPIVALLAALDALRANKIPLTGNRALHSGHYGNWAPNPGFSLARLLTSMKSADGKVLIEGFYDDIVPLNTTEKDALAAMPSNDADVQRELQFAKPQSSGQHLAESLQFPSLNIRGLRSAYVGEQTQNVVPEKATAAMDIRLVKGEDPDKKFEQILDHIRKQGFFVTTSEPTKEERLAHAEIARVVKDSSNYPASRTSMELPVSQALIKTVQDATGGETVVAPMLGGSVPMYIFEKLGMPWIGVPIVNYDNHQHSSDENLRLGQLWRGIEIYGAILADLDW
jgi:acetylornithine deacetylase/succinyl-diaminopimelate desuccinylase-like protein